MREGHTMTADIVVKGVQAIQMVPTPEAELKTLLESWETEVSTLPHLQSLEALADFVARVTAAGFGASDWTMAATMSVVDATGNLSSVVVLNAQNKIKPNIVNHWHPDEKYARRYMVDHELTHVKDHRAAVNDGLSDWIHLPTNPSVDAYLACLGGVLWLEYHAVRFALCRLPAERRASVITGFLEAQQCLNEFENIHQSISATGRGQNVNHVENGIRGALVSLAQLLGAQDCQADIYNMTPLRRHHSYLAAIAPIEAELLGILRMAYDQIPTLPMSIVDDLKRIAFEIHRGMGIDVTPVGSGADLIRR